MTELWLRYINEEGKEKRLLVEKEKFTIGRHSDNDLSIINSAVSRKHIEINRFDDIFIVSDNGSSLGTKINGQELTEPVALNDGDELDLGGGLKIRAEILSDESAQAAADKKEAKQTENASVSALPSSSGISSQSTSDKTSIFSNVFIIAPIFGLFALLFVGGLFFALKGNDKEVAEKKESNLIFKSERESPRVNKINENSPEEPISTPSETNVEITVDNSNTETPTPEQQTTPKVSGEMDLIEKDSALFLRKIAKNDPNAFLTGKQQELIKPFIDRYKNVSGLSENIKSINRNSSQIKNLAASKSIEPQLLAIAALASLENRSGDLSATAQSIADVLGNLKQNIGDELADESLLIVAAYQQSAEGKSSSIIGTLADLTRKFPDSPRRIRSIWFLKDNDKISDEQFDFALRFLALGTIAQNPKNFGVNAEGINL